MSIVSGNCGFVMAETLVEPDFRRFGLLDHRSRAVVPPLRNRQRRLRRRRLLQKGHRIDLMSIVATVTHPDRKETNHRMIPGRTAYTKAFKDFGIIAITEKESDTIAKVFTYFPRRGGKKR